MFRTWFYRSLAVIGLVSIAAGLAFCFSNTVHAAVCAPATINLIPRASDNSLVPGLNYAIYEQNKNVDGTPILGKAVTSGKIQATGQSVVSVAINAAATTPGAYAVVLYDKHPTLGAFTYFNQVQVSCGDTFNFTPTLSSIGIIIRDADNLILANTPFSLYAMLKNADGKPITDASRLIANFNTGSGGSVTTYVAAPETSSDTTYGGQYILVVKPATGGQFIKSDIKVVDKQKLVISYVLGELRVQVRDVNHQSYAQGTGVALYTQPAGVDQLGTLLKTASLDANGRARFIWPAGTYAVRVSGKSASFNFFSEDIPDQGRQDDYLDTTENLSTQVTCTSTAEVDVVANTGSGELIPNLRIDLLEAGTVAVGTTISSKVIATGVTDASGRVALRANMSEYKNYSLRASTTGVTVGQFYQSGVTAKCGEKKQIALTMSLLNLTMLNADRQPIANAEFQLYGENTNGDQKTKNLDFSGTYKTDAAGFARAYLSQGYYIFSYKNSSGTEFLVYDLQMPYQQDKTYTFIASEGLIRVQSTSGQPAPAGTLVELYEQKTTGPNSYYFGNKVASMHLDPTGSALVQYPAGIYGALVQLSNGTQSVHWNIRINDGTRTENDLVIEASFPSSGKTPTSSSPSPVTPSVPAPAPATTRADNTLIGRLQGRIVLQVQSHGEAYYIDGRTRKRYYLKNGEAALAIIRKLALGITNDNIKKIPIGIINSGADTDGDGLPDDLERAIGTDPFSADTDGDGFTDGVEVKSGYNPLGSGTLPVDTALITRLRGRIVLQVEDKGEAWYIDPKTAKRYYMATGDAAYQVMRQFGLGITTADLQRIPLGTQ